MTQVTRFMKPTSPLLLVAAVGLALAPPAAAQPEEATPSEEAQPEAAAPAPAAPAVPAAAEAPAAPAGVAPAAQPVPGQPVAGASPAQVFAPPPGYPYAYQPLPPRPERTEDTGPTFSWEPLRLAIALEHRTSWLREDAAQRMAGGERASAGGLSVQADVLRPRDQVVLRADLAWLNQTHSAYRDGSSPSEQLKSNLVALGASLRYDLWCWLAPFARVTAGLGWDKLTVADLHDRQFFGQGTVGAGLVLRSPGLHLWRGKHSAVGLVGQVEGGYALASGSDFVLHADARASGDHPIPTSDVALGRVSRSVPYLRVSLGLAFY
jgi:hypothetical protein